MPKPLSRPAARALASPAPASLAPAAYALAAALLAFAPPLAAADAVPAPGEIVAAAPAADWSPIAPDDLLVMDLAPDAAGKPRRVVIQLLPPPFSQGWIGNIRKLAAAHWWDGLSINRVQDNYVVQWGDADGEDKARARPLPPGLAALSAADYVAPWRPALVPYALTAAGQIPPEIGPIAAVAPGSVTARVGDGYAEAYGFRGGFPVALGYPDRRDANPFAAIAPESAWPIHCYGAVGVGRDMPPDAGTGAELYTVIGSPPRHLDRNIAVVGRVIEGIEHLSSLPRGTGPLGFYTTAAERTAIRSIRLGGAVADLPRYQSLATDSASFARYAEARANRRDAFFVRPAGGVDICNLPVPVRRAP